jgi:TatD DNase family protein
MKKEWIDGHCHLADPRHQNELHELIVQSRQAGITGWVQGGVDPQDWDRQLALRAQWGDCVVPVFGLHPWWVARASPTELEAALRLLEAALPKAAALGETGLDAHPAHGGNLPLQTRAFEVQLRLAASVGKPVVLHVVQAHEEALAVLTRNPRLLHGGLVHGFSGSLEIARNYLALGLSLSVGSGVLKPGYKALKAALPHLPSDQLVLETDWPDGVAGPQALVAIAEAVAKLQNRRPEEVLDASTFRLNALFRK